VNSDDYGSTDDHSDRQTATNPINPTSAMLPGASDGGAFA